MGFVVVCGCAVRPRPVTKAGSMSCWECIISNGYIVMYIISDFVDRVILVWLKNNTVNIPVIIIIRMNSVIINEISLIRSIIARITDNSASTVLYLINYVVIYLTVSSPNNIQTIASALLCKVVL